MPDTVHAQAINETEILYEISLSIGRTLELEAMLKQSLGTLMRLCNCNAAVVLRYQVDCEECKRLISLEAPIAWDKVYVAPRNIANKPEYVQFRESLALPMRICEISAWTQGLPRAAPGAVAGQTFYAFNLPDFGVLVLHRTGEAMRETFVQSLQKLMDKLAYSAKACLYEAELKHQMEAAQAANVAKSRFLANMSHEIRTPMNGILGMLDIVLETPLEKSQQDYLRLAKLSAQHLLGIINQVLDISKIEANKVDLHEEVLDLVDFIGKVMQTQSALALAKDIQLHYRLGAKLPRYVTADRVRLQQILVNLLGNALKFTERGSVTLEANALDSDAGDQCLLSFHIKDTGIGIPQDKLVRIFDAFEQVDTQRNRKYEGTGLGLAITKQLVELMQGQISVGSELGKGSQFTVKLPLPLADPAAIIDTAPPHCPQIRKVLFVDDEPINREVFAAMMQIIDLPHEICSSGPEAIFRLKWAREAQEPFDLVFMDSHMPGMDGYTAAEQIIKNGLLEGHQILILTASALKEESERCKELDLLGYLTKPIALNDLRAVFAQNARLNAPPQDVSALAQTTRPLAILLAEDNQINQMVALKLLEKIHAQCSVANNGAEAVRMAQEKDFDLILMDIMMPVMDGIEAIRCIREDAQTHGRPFVPIIAMTANTMKGDKEYYLSEGVQGYVAKPVEPSALYLEIERVVAEHPVSHRVKKSARLSGLDDLLALGDADTEDTWRHLPDVAPNMETAQSSDAIPTEAPLLLDWDRAVKQLGGEAAILSTALTMFTEGLPQTFEDMRQAFADQDIARLALLAHTLKSQCATFCAAPAQAAALNLEQLCKAKETPAQIEAALKQLLRELEALDTAIQSTAQQRQPIESAQRTRLA
ncbi:response regulator [Thiorhodospira sibirica]|uniref:response regulator n=1 Tax=Thiorhodospira sibirica TaxID=154347 RepID=UPI00022C5E64|nr:response regulator [Thiorhodospira sibirica]